MNSRNLRTLLHAPLLALAAAAITLTLGCSNQSNQTEPNSDIDIDQPEVLGGVLHWREISQNGTSPQTGLPEQAILEGDSANLRWTLDVPGRGTAAIAEYADGPRLFVLGYPGENAGLTETLYCLNPDTGEELWSKPYADFISDIVYNRYTIGGPTVDPETGHVYIHTAPGLLVALTRDGDELWRISLMEAFGRLTFPNGRTGAVTLDGDLAIVNIISTNWGSEGPARNRFYAFNKHNGQLVWSSTPGVGPPFLADSSFSTPYIENRQNHRVFYAGTGCGNLVCVNIRTGQPLWRFQMSLGGVNSSPLIFDNQTPDDPTDDLIIQVHGKENVGDSGRGYMIALKAEDALAAALKADELPLQITDDLAAWRNNDVSMFTSSPTLVDGVVYQCALDGRLIAIDAKTGETLWEKKLGASQLHASPLFADGRLYIPVWNDGLIIIKPGRTMPEGFEQTLLPGKNIGTASAWNGKLYVHTTDALFCFGSEKGTTPTPQTNPFLDLAFNKPRTAKALHVTPSEFLLKPGESIQLDATPIDEYGTATNKTLTDLRYETFIPPTARVKAELNAEPRGSMIGASTENAPSAGAFKATADGLTGTARGRILPVPPYAKDFQEFELTLTDGTDNVPYAHPPLPWIGARMKWQVRDDPTDEGDNLVLAKTLDRVLFQRSMIFMGHPDDTGYSIQADVMSDGNRRGGSVVGVICQRYIIALDANKNVIEISSNPNRLQVTEKYPFKTGVWYTIKAKVTVNADGTGTVHGKAWPRGEDEPAEWTIAVDVPKVHQSGSPGIYGFSPQSRHRVYVDNVKVEPTE